MKKIFTIHISSSVVGFQAIDPAIVYFFQGTIINSTEDEHRYSRAYISELASQYREEELLIRVFLIIEHNLQYCFLFLH